MALATVEGREVLTYGRHEVNLSATDSEGTTKGRRHSFIACDFDVDGVSIILGFPWLQAVDPVISFRERTWRYPFERAQISVLSAQKFNKKTWKQTVYCVVLKTILTSKNKLLPAKYREFSDVFDARKAGILPEHGPMEHRIDLVPGKEVPWGPVYPLSESELLILREYLDTSLAKGWIRRSTSPAGAPILFVPKKGGGLRLCVDYRGLNAATVKNRTPLPLISETLDRLRRAVVFTKLDLKDAYHRLRIKEGDEWKTAFRTRYGHFEYCVLPFGLSNAPATFQAYINQALIGLVDVTCVVYLDDILIFSEDPSQHEDAVRQVLERLRSYQLYANLEKCEFETDTVEFLGFLVGPKGIQMDPSRVESISSWPVPESFRDIQVFLGFTNFYRRFIKSYSKITLPLTDLLKGMEKGKKTGPFRLTDEAVSAFYNLRQTFTSAPLLRHFDPSLKIRIETDASKFAIGGILSQLFGTGSDARWHPVAFYSRKLSAVEQRYEVHDGELMAIVFAFKQWGQYLRGASDTVVVLSDHNNLKYFMTKKKLTGRQARWAESLAEYDFRIEYRTGRTNPADGPSRRPDYQHSDETEDVGMLPTLQNKLRIAALSEGKLSKKLLASILSNGERKPGASRAPIGDESWFGHRPHMQESWAKQSCESAGAAGCKQRVPRSIAIALLEAETEDGTVSDSFLETLIELQSMEPFVFEKEYESQPRSVRSGAGEDWKVDPKGLLRFRGKAYVPNESSIRAEIILRHHDADTAGHFGVARTLEVVGRKYHWNGMKKDIKSYIRSCPECQRGKAKRHRPHGELAPAPQPQRPWQEITMDFITDLPPSNFHGRIYDSILVVVDRYTKMARYIPCNKTITATELVDTFMGKIYKDFGAPEGITSDRGSVFTSKFWGTFIWYLKTRRRLSTAFHPQTDGQTERQNQTLEFYLRCYCNYRQDDWTSKLALAEFTYNNSVHATTKTSPFRYLYGFDPELGFNVGDAVLEGGAISAEERVKIIAKERALLTDNLRKATDSHKKYYDAKHKASRFKVKEKVLLSAKYVRQLRPSRKLSDKYLGPFEILEIKGEHGQAYKLKLPPSYRIHDVFHVSLLEPWTGREGVETDPGPIEVQGQEEFEVKSIQAHREDSRGRQYLVR